MPGPLSFCGGVGGGWGLHSHFHVQPNYSVEVVLCCSLGCDNLLIRFEGVLVSGEFKCSSR